MIELLGFLASIYTFAQLLEYASEPHPRGRVACYYLCAVAAFGAVAVNGVFLVGVIR